MAEVFIKDDRGERSTGIDTKDLALRKIDRPEIDGNVHAFSIGHILKRDDAVTTKQMDVYYNQYGVRSGDTLKPPYTLSVLARMPMVSDILKQCVNAYKTNIVGLGFQFTKADHLKDEDEDTAEMQDEQRMLHELFNYPNYSQDFTKLAEELLDDKYTIGYWCMEVVRNRAGEIAELYRLPASSMRMTIPDEEFTEFTQPILGEDGTYIEKIRMNRFKRWVQYYGYGQKVHFKEFGDPREISSESGKEVPGGDATEVISSQEMNSYSPYGVPLWMGCFLGMIGARKSEEVNMDFFDNKTIPPMVITVSGGILTKNAINAIKEVLDTEVRGSENFHKSLVLEAKPLSASTIEGEKIAPVKIDVKPLTEYIQDDATFKEYRKDNRSNVRSAFRLPPIYTGNSDDYTRATALESIKVTENQVFIPLRNSFESLLNRTILADMRINTLRIKFNGVKMSDDADILRAIGSVKEAAPIGIVQDAITDMLGRTRLKIDEDMYKIPMSLVNSTRALLPESAQQQQMQPDVPNNNNNNDEEDNLEKITKRLYELKRRIVKKIVDEGRNKDVPY